MGLRKQGVLRRPRAFSSFHNGVGLSSRVTAHFDQPLPWIKTLCRSTVSSSMRHISATTRRSYHHCWSVLGSPPPQLQLRRGSSSPPPASPRPSHVGTGPGHATAGRRAGKAPKVATDCPAQVGSWVNCLGCSTSSPNGIYWNNLNSRRMPQVNW